MKIKNSYVTDIIIEFTYNKRDNYTVNKEKLCKSYLDAKMSCDLTLETDTKIVYQIKILRLILFLLEMKTYYLIC